MDLVLTERKSISAVGGHHSACQDRWIVKVKNKRVKIVRKHQKKGNFKESDKKKRVLDDAFVVCVGRRKSGPRVRVLLGVASKNSLLVHFLSVSAINF